MGKVAGYFPVGDTGESFVVAEWHPDPALIEKDLIQMADNFDDWMVPMQEARELMIENTRVLFREEREPSGRHWVPLDPVYEIDKRRAGYDGKTILRRTDALFEAATSEEAWFVTQDAVFFNPGALPKYGPIHQDGSGKPGTTGYHRIMRTQTPEQISQLFRNKPEVQKAVMAFEPAEGSGNNLPARPFIGANLATIEKIEAAFLNHIHNRIEVPWRTLGGAGGISFEEPLPMTGTNILGTFEVMSYLRSGQPILRTPRGPRFGRM